MNAPPTAPLAFTRALQLPAFDGMESTRTLGRSGIQVSVLGFGCWAIGGEHRAADGQPLGRGRADNEESVGRSAAPSTSE